MTAVNLNPKLILNKLLAELGEPWLPVHHQALEAVEAVEAGDAEMLRHGLILLSCSQNAFPLK
jgi:hypothetical protein